ncbi:hypothetical protein GGS21DRAFT_549517 [Xylaria nigripes]|nr:hypothetical protein GGS21DRAFT_549517 [Xylaria nigripes]
MSICNQLGQGTCWCAHWAQEFYNEQLHLASPGTSEAATFTVLQQSGRLGEFHLPLDGSQKWAFTYNTYDRLSCHKLPSGGPYPYIPYVINHAVEPGNQQLSIRTQYTYSTNNFLGYDAVYKLKNDENNLYQARDTYQYTSTILVSGGQKTTNTYNKFHLLLKSKKLLDIKEMTQEVTYYALPNLAFEGQPPQFQLSKSVKITYRDTTTKASREERPSIALTNGDIPPQMSKTMACERIVSAIHLMGKMASAQLIPMTSSGI